MGTQQSDETARALSDAGVPRHVIDYVARYRAIPFHRWLFVLPIVAILIAGGKIAFHMLDRLKDATGANARAFAAPIDGILYHHNFGIWLILGFFGILFADFAIVSLTVLLSRRAMASSFVLSVLDPKHSRFSKWMIDKQLLHLKFESDPARYVRRFARDPVLISAAIAVFLFAISALAAHRETRTYQIFTPTTYVVAPFLPWNATPPREWASAVSVETGCNHVSDKHGVRETIIYDVNFEDGTVAHVGDGIPIDGSWLDAAETIDRNVRASGATFHPWTWLWRESYHPLCVAALRDQSSDAEFERLETLLRLPEQPR